MKIKDDEINVTKKILSTDLFELSQGEEHARSKANQIKKGVSANDYKDYKDMAYSSAEELERGVGDHLTALENLQNDLEEEIDKESFQEDFENGRGFVDAETFQQALDIIDIYKDVVPRLTLVRLILWELSKQQDKLIDIQQLAHDEGRIKDFIDETSEWQKKKFERMIESFEEYIDRTDQNLEDIQDEMNSIKKTEAKKTDDLNETLDQLSQVLGSMQQTGVQQPQYNPAQGSPYTGQQNQQQAVNQGQQPQNNSAAQRQSQNIQTQQTGQNGQQTPQNQNPMPDLDQFELNDKERELVEKYFEMKDEPEFQQKDLAEKVGYGRSTVSEKLNEFEQRGIIPERG